MEIKTSTFFILSVLLCALSTSRAHQTGRTAVYIVYTDTPKTTDPKAFYIKTLSAVLGSEEAAKESFLYSYKYATSGFAAKLTPAQAKEISKQPGVLEVVPNKNTKLDESEAPATAPSSGDGVTEYSWVVYG